MSTLQVIHPQEWEENPDFVEEVQRVWKDNPFWYCICREGEGSFEGLWGELHDPNEPNHKRTCFLGHTKSQVLPRMKTCLSCQ